MSTTILVLAAALLAACNLSAAPAATSTPPVPLATATVAPTYTPVSDTAVLPVIGAAGLHPSGAGPCVMTAESENAPLYQKPDTSAVALAALGAGLGEVPFRWQEGWYATSWYVGDVEVVGWVEEWLVRVEGLCDYLRIPPVCSVEASAGRSVDIYDDPRRDSPVVAALADQHTIPFVERSADGWLGVYLGEIGTGWIAPDEGRLIGC